LAVNEFLFLAVILCFEKLTKTPHPQSYLSVLIWMSLPGTKKGMMFSGLTTIFLISSFIVLP